MPSSTPRRGYGYDADAAQQAHDAAQTLGYDSVNERLRDAERRSRFHAQEEAERLAAEAAYVRDEHRRQQEFAWYADTPASDDFSWQEPASDEPPPKQGTTRTAGASEADSSGRYRAAYVLVDRERHPGSVRVARDVVPVVIRGFHQVALVMDRCRSLGATAVGRPDVVVVRFARRAARWTDRLRRGRGKSQLGAQPHPGPLIWRARRVASPSRKARRRRWKCLSRAHPSRLRPSRRGSERPRRNGRAADEESSV